MSDPRITMKTKQISNLSSLVIVVNMQSSFALVSLAANHATMLLPPRFALVFSHRETQFRVQVSIFALPFWLGETSLFVCS